MHKNHYFVLILGLLPLISLAEPLVDPTRPASYRAQDSMQQQITSPTHREWTLDTTIISSYQRLAIINGKKLAIGDDINEATLLNIDHQKVKLRYQGKVITLTLHNSFISKIKPGSN
jgi:hypothetical protein